MNVILGIKQSISTWYKIIRENRPEQVVYWTHSWKLNTDSSQEKYIQKGDTVFFVDNKSCYMSGEFVDSFVCDTKTLFEKYRPIELGLKEDATLQDFLDTLSETFQESFNEESPVGAVIANKMFYFPKAREMKEKANIRGKYIPTDVYPFCD